MARNSYLKPSYEYNQNDDIYSKRATQESSFMPARTSNGQYLLP